MFHIRKYTNFFISFKFWKVSHETDEKIKIRLGKKKKERKLLGSDIFGFLRTTVHNIRAPETFSNFASFFFLIMMYSNNINIYEQKYLF